MENEIMMAEKNILKKAIVVESELHIRTSIEAQLTKKTPINRMIAPILGDRLEIFTFEINA